MHRYSLLFFLIHMLSYYIRLGGVFLFLAGNVTRFAAGIHKVFLIIFHCVGGSFRYYFKLVQLSLCWANWLKHHGNKHHSEYPIIIRAETIQKFLSAKPNCSH